MQRPETNNKTLPTRLSPMEGQQKEIQYSLKLLTFFLDVKYTKIHNIIRKFSRPQKETLGIVYF